MPVDLSNIGLQGLESHQQRMESASRVRESESRVASQQIEREAFERKQALADEASARLNALSQRKGTGSFDASSVADQMESLADPLETVADVYLRGGAPETGMDFLKNASEIRKRESDIENDEVLGQQRKLENIIKGADVVSRYLGQAKNQSEWDYGVDQLRKQGVMEPDLIDQIGKMPYDPDVAAYFNEQAISSADKARLDMTSQTEARISKKDRIDALQADQRIRMQAARDAEAARHNKAIEKASGGKTSATVPPNSDAMRSVKAALRNTVYTKLGDVKEGKEGPDFGAAAEFVASTAQTLVRDNKAMDWNTAVQRAILQGQQSNAFGTEAGETHWFKKDEPDTAKFDGQGLTVETAIPPPVDKNGKVTGLKRGRWYVLTDGRRGQFNGKGMIVPD